MIPQKEITGDQSAATQKGNKVWFITGSSRGFGRIWTLAALQRGDKVIATARNIESIADLNDKYGSQVLTMEMDVTKGDQVQKVIEKGHAHFGKIDIVLNNAGYSLVGTIEEANADEVRALYETNIFGSLSVIKAVLPLLRKQGGGHILGVSSSLGHITMPVIGYYCSSKWAFEAIHESLAAEVKAFGIKVTILEPGAYATEFGSPASLKFTKGIEIYEEIKAQLIEGLKTLERGDPNATTHALFKIVDAAQPPLRVFLGSKALSEVRAAYAERLKVWEGWQEISASAQGSPIH